MDAYASRAMPLPTGVRASMTGVSWRPGCPVALDDLVLLELRHWGFDGQSTPTCAAGACLPRPAWPTSTAPMSAQA